MTAVPAVFEALARQDAAIRLLHRSLQSHQLSHAYIFKGPVAIGCQLALALAQALFCPQKGCGICSVCQSVAEGHYPDLYIIAADSESKNPQIKLPQMKQLVAQVALPPLQSRYQIFMIQDADLLNKESSNALLKTLEEPLSNSIIILLTSLISRLLPTIRSRAQIVPLRDQCRTHEIMSSQDNSEKYWNWAQLEQINSPQQLPLLLSHLEGLNHSELTLQMQIFQRECWEKIRGFIISKQSVIGLKRAYRYLELFEQAHRQAKSGVHIKLFSENLGQQFLQLRQNL